jgi:fructoselysine-6-P-deglycase FrlB-like protein
MGQFSGETPEVIAALKACDISTRQVVAIHTVPRCCAFPTLS